MKGEENCMGSVYGQCQIVRVLHNGQNPCDAIEGVDERRGRIV
jgi:hypothetical protein